MINPEALFESACEERHIEEKAMLDVRARV